MDCHCVCTVTGIVLSHQFVRGGGGEDSFFSPRVEYSCRE